jgi:hypothetical protein
VTRYERALLFTVIAIALKGGPFKIVSAIILGIAVKVIDNWQAGGVGNESSCYKP